MDSAIVEKVFADNRSETKPIQFNSINLLFCVWFASFRIIVAPFKCRVLRTVCASPHVHRSNHEHETEHGNVS